MDPSRRRERDSLPVQHRPPASPPEPCPSAKWTPRVARNRRPLSGNLRDQTPPAPHPFGGRTPLEECPPLSRARRGGLRRFRIGSRHLPGLPYCCLSVSGRDLRLRRAGRDAALGSLPAALSPGRPDRSSASMIPASSPRSPLDRPAG